MSGYQVLKRTLAFVVFIAATALMGHLIGDLDRVKVLETDLARFHHARYGLLDADQWVERISAIIAKRIDEFEVTDANRPQIVAAVSRVLDTVLNQVERYLRQRNLRSGGNWMDQLQGALNQGLQDLFIDFDSLHKKVPQFSRVLVDQLSQPQTKEEIKTQLLALLRQTSEVTFAKVDRSQLDALLAEYGCSDVAQCSRQLQSRIAAQTVPIRQQLGGVVGLVVLLFLFCLGGEARALRSGGRADFDSFKLSLLTGAILILLAGGLLTPMIEIEARIDELRLEFLGEPLVFTDQVLYFQSKSIFDVVRILMQTGGADMLLVALLVTLFSVVFPALKLITTYVYYFDFRQARSRAWVRFFALRSGKWSMADVLVVAIFMAYLGFDALMANQLQGLARPGEAGGGALNTSLLTTNGTSLEPGFYLFLSFVLANLVLSVILERHGEDGEARS